MQPFSVGLAVHAVCAYQQQSGSRVSSDAEVQASELQIGPPREQTSFIDVVGAVVDEDVVSPSPSPTIPDTITRSIPKNIMSLVSSKAMTIVKRLPVSTKPWTNV